MLVLSRKVRESVVVSESIEVTVEAITTEMVALSASTPEEVSVTRDPNRVLTSDPSLYWLDVGEALHINGPGFGPVTVTVVKILKPPGSEGRVRLGFTAPPDVGIYKRE